MSNKDHYYSYSHSYYCHLLKIMFSSRIFKAQTALQRFIRTLRSEDSDGSETSLKKEVRVLSIFIAVTPSH